MMSLPAACTERFKKEVATLAAPTAAEDFKKLRRPSWFCVGCDEAAEGEAVGITSEAVVCSVDMEIVPESELQREGHANLGGPSQRRWVSKGS
jgi:hypothetical protein